MGLYAENLVLREMVTWSEKIEISYFREKTNEVDFILTHGGNRYLPVEVKHRGRVDPPRGLRHFMKRYKLRFGVVITRDTQVKMDDLLYLPLRYFLLAT
jgi:predicted AAA+ superfamily ATPase